MYCCRYWYIEKHVFSTTHWHCWKYTQEQCSLFLVIVITWYPSPYIVIEHFHKNPWLWSRIRSASRGRMLIGFPQTDSWVRSHGRSTERDTKNGTPKSLMFVFISQIVPNNYKNGVSKSPWDIAEIIELVWKIKQKIALSVVYNELLDIWNMTYSC